MRKMLLFALLATLMGTQTAEARKPTYLGYTGCKGCHRKQYESWKDTTMAQTFNALVPGVNTEGKSEAGLDPQEDFTNNPKCLRCHATGYGEPGGFTSFEETVSLAGVACEACHGAGERYYGLMSKKRKTYRLIELLKAGFVRPNQKTCNKCHVPGCPLADDDHEMDFDDSSGHDRFPLKYQH